MKLNEAIQEQIEITNPVVVPVLFHTIKQQILKQLIRQEMTIVDLKRALGINPGTIKRHLDDLVKVGLALQVRTVENRYKVVMRFFRATAKQFIVKLIWPESLDLQ